MSAGVLVSDPGSLVEESPPAVAREEYLSRVIAGGLPPAPRRVWPADRAQRTIRIRRHEAQTPSA